MKALKIIAVGIAAIVAIGVGVVVFGVPAGFLTGAIRERVEKETGYRLDIAGASRLSLLPHPVLELRNVTLTDPKDFDGDRRFSIDSVQADISVRSLFSGPVRLRELTIVHPVATLPLIRERTRQLSSGSRKTTVTVPEGSTALPVDLITVTNGALIMRNTRERLERRLDSINIKAVSAPDRQLIINADAKSGEQPIRLEAKATIAQGQVDGLTVPVEFKFDAPGVLPQSVSASGEVRLSGSTVTLNGLAGQFGTARFSGYASADLAGKPLVKADLDFQRLDFEDSKPSLNAAAPASAAPSAGGWSNADIDLRGLNFVDGQINVSAATLGLGALRLAPVKIESTVDNGILRMLLSDIGLYDGQASAGFAVDASAATPVYALRATLVGVRALPLLTSIADFTSIDGRMQGQIDVRSMGRTQSELMSHMSGVATFTFRDGQIIGINVAEMIRSLTATTLSGWQRDTPAAASGTDLTELAASFQIDKGQAATSDLRLAGPLVRMTGSGTVSLPGRSLSFRTEPKLVMTTQGQGGPASPVGLGVPVVIDGPWASPRIYPEISGILDNPDAAFGKLREMGQGLFGPGMLGAGGKSGDLIGNIGSMIKGLGGAPQAEQKPPDARPGDQKPAATQPSASPSDPKAFPIDRIIRDLFGR